MVVPVVYTLALAEPSYQGELDSSLSVEQDQGKAHCAPGA